MYLQETTNSQKSHQTQKTLKTKQKRKGHDPSCTTLVGCRLELRVRSGQGGQAKIAGAGLPPRPAQGAGPKHSHPGLVDSVRGVASGSPPRMRAQALGPTLVCDWRTWTRGRASGCAGARSGHVPRCDLGAGRLYHGGLSPAAGRTNPGAEGKKRTGETYPALSLALSCTCGVRAVRRSQGLCSPDPERRGFSAGAKPRLLGCLKSKT